MGGKASERDGDRQREGLEGGGVGTHIWMWDGVLSLNGVGLRTGEEELTVSLLARHRRVECTTQ